MPEMWHDSKGYCRQGESIVPGCKNLLFQKELDLDLTNKKFYKMELTEVQYSYP